MRIKGYIKIIQREASKWRVGLSQYNYSLFLSPEWIESVADSSHQPIYLDFINEDKVVAKLSGLICVESWLKGSQLYFYAAPAFLQSTLHLFDACYQALRQWAIEKRFTRVIIASYDQQTVQQCGAKGYFLNFRYEYIIDFKENGGPAKFATGFKKNYKKAQKLGASFFMDNKNGTLDRLLTLLGVTKDLRTNKYGCSYNPFYLKNMSAESLHKLVVSGAGKLYCACLDNKVCSVQFNIECDNKSYGLLMGSDDSAYKNGLPSFVDFNLIEQYQTLGFNYYNPGGGPVDEGGSGIEQYKKAMGAQKYIFTGATTNFLVYPQKLLNPLLYLGRKLPSSDKGIVGFLKKLV